MAGWGCMTAGVCVVVRSRITSEHMLLSLRDDNNNNGRTFGCYFTNIILFRSCINKSFKKFSYVISGGS